MPRPKPSVYVPFQSDCDLVTPDDSIVQRFIQYNIDTGRARLSHDPETADYIVLFQYWSFKLPAYVKVLCQNALIQKYAEKVYVVNYDSTVGEGFLPGCYVSLRKSTFNPASFAPCAYPKIYNENITTHNVKNQNPEYLVSFRGTLLSHPIRQTMYNALRDCANSKIVVNNTEFHTHTKDEKLRYIDDILHSVFVLCPRGSSPNSYRIFETMSLGRCPVIISDEWIETPGPDWSTFSIRVSEDNVSNLENVLIKRKAEGLEMGRIAQQAWQTHFTQEATYKTYLDKIDGLHHSHVRPVRNFQQLRKHWRSKPFLDNNDWTLKQKVMRRIQRFL